MRKFKLKEELKKGYAGIPYDVHLILPGIYISRKLRKYKKGKERAIHGLGVMMANILLGDLRRSYQKQAFLYCRKDKKQIVNLKSKIDESYKSLPHVHSNKVWVCWMQGMENAPEVVKVCYQSILDNFKDREVVLITAENVSEYAEFPDYVIDKYKRGIITHTHFSDILRLELLNRYGGTWIDATMFCTDSNFPDYMLNDKLFIVQNIEDSAVQIESFFITAESHNKLLELTVKAIDYNLESPFNERVYNEILKLTPIHKLTYKKPIKDGTYFDYIIKNYKAFK